MKPKKKDPNYIPILDQPTEELKKPMGNPVNFGQVVESILKCIEERKEKKVSPAMNK